MLSSKELTLQTKNKKFATSVPEVPKLQGPKDPKQVCGWRCTWLSLLLEYILKYYQYHLYRLHKLLTDLWNVSRPISVLPGRQLGRLVSSPLPHLHHELFSRSRDHAVPVVAIAAGAPAGPWAVGVGTGDAVRVLVWDRDARSVFDVHRSLDCGRKRKLVIPVENLVNAYANWFKN